MSSGFSGHGMQWALATHHCTLLLTIFMPFGVFLHRLGGGYYRVRFCPWWWIFLFFKWYLMWGCWCSWFSLTFFCLSVLLIYLLLVYLPLYVSGSYFSFDPLFWYVFQLSQVCFFLRFFHRRCLPVFLIFFSVTKGVNREAGAGFFSMLIKSVAVWVAASAY